jgi:hypothetical protein
MDSTAIFDAVRSVTGSWARQRKAEEREVARLSRRRDALIRSRRMTVREAAWRIMPQAYLKASSNGTLPAHARQIMYAARGEIQRLAGHTLDDQYFTQHLLPDFMNEHASATAGWDVVFDARGHLHEPHTGTIVPLGTIEVRRHLREVAAHTLPELQVDLPEMAVFPTCGPGHRYGAIAFVEKEGFLPLFRAVRLAERYDLAIMSTKGLSVTASRLLVDRLCAAHQVPLLVLHDFDKSGFSILGTLRRWRDGHDHYWCGARDQGDVWHFDKPARNDLHPTMKPVALVERAIRNSSKTRDTVLDPFGGSGSTLIACEKTGRQARLVELDPRYFDVIVRRWQGWSGEKATLKSDGRSFEEIAAQAREASDCSTAA